MLKKNQIFEISRMAQWKKMWNTTNIILSPNDPKEIDLTDEYIWSMTIHFKKKTEKEIKKFLS